MARLLANGRSRIAFELKAAAGAESKPQDVKQAAQALNIAFVSAEVFSDSTLVSTTPYN